MYIPSHFEVTDPERLFPVIRDFSFATVVTHDGKAPFASHLPILLDEAGEPRLLGHMARANPQWRHFENGEALVIFQGPHGYISPSWYEGTKVVPTWNYVTVHAYGTAKLMDDDALVSVIDRTVAKYESGRPQPWRANLPAEFKDALMKAIVGFEIPIARMEGKFKLGQNRSAADTQGAVEGLRESGDPLDALLADWMAGASGA
jgi:transcriptional regulator